MHILIKTVKKTTQTNMQFQFVVSDVIIVIVVIVVVVMHDNDSQSQEYTQRSYTMYARVLVDELSFCCVLLLFVRLI